jgi:hypothetical protein
MCRGVISRKGHEVNTFGREVRKAEMAESNVGLTLQTITV